MEKYVFIEIVFLSFMVSNIAQCQRKVFRFKIKKELVG